MTTFFTSNKSDSAAHKRLLVSLCFFISCVTVRAQDAKELINSLEKCNDSTLIIRIEQLNDKQEKPIVFQFHERIRTIIEKGREHTHSITVIKARFLYYSYLNFQKDYYNALKVLVDILHSKTAISKSDSIRLYSNIARIYAEIGVFSRAYDFQDYMEQMAGSKNLHKNLSLYTKSMLFTKFKMHNRAIEQLRIEFNYIPGNLRTATAKASFHNNLGFHWTKIGNADSALSHLQIALVHAKEIDSSSNPKIALFFPGLIKGNIGQALMLKKKFTEAIPFLKEDVYISKQVDELENAALSQYELARCLLAKGSPGQALNYIDSALEVITKKSNYTSYIILKKFRAEIFFRTGEINNYNLTMREIQLIEDSLQHVVDNNELVNNEVLLAIFKHEKDLRKKELDFKKQEDLAEQNKIWRNYITIVLISLSVIVIILVLNTVANHKKRKILSASNKKINDQNIIIEESLREKDILIKEIHHRVKNNLQMVSSLLNLQSNRVNDDAARTALRESISRLDSMAIIHQQLYGKSDFRTIRIDTYLNQLITQIERGYGHDNRSVKINLDIQPVPFNLDVAIPIGIIMNEVITNCYKHAFIKKNTGTVNVSLKTKNGKVHLIISDDGDGLPSDFEDKKQNSLGQELIVLLVDQLGGQLNIKSDKGTQYNIVF